MSLSFITRPKKLILLGLLLFIFTPTLAMAEPTFTSDLFKEKWQRADKLVSEITASPARSWLWGPESFQPATEPYSDAPGGTRQVLYFDKARMEINNPATGIVTNGLLVRELVSGKLATGDTGFIQRQSPRDIPVAGDPINNNSPTYASFTRIASLNNDHPSPDRTGSPVQDTIDQSGNIGSSTELGTKAKYVYFDSTGLKHNIPDVFWNFLNQKGSVYVNGGVLVNQPVLGDNPLAPWLDATGLPLTEAYWAKATVSGQLKDVLIQAFERRVLTYTPDNPAGFQVEMGNVGRHYFQWRSDKKYDYLAWYDKVLSPSNYLKVCTLPGDSATLIIGQQSDSFTGTLSYNLSTGEKKQLSKVITMACDSDTFFGYYTIYNPYSGVPRPQAYRFTLKDLIEKPVEHVPTNVAEDGSGQLYSLESNFQDVYSTRLWASVDGGLSWQERGQELKNTLQNIAVDSTGARNLYGASVTYEWKGNSQVANYTVYFSSDAGKSWQAGYKGSFEGSTFRPGVLVKTLPGRAAVASTVTLEVSAPGAAIGFGTYVSLSTDSGKTFNPVGQAHSQQPQNVQLVQTNNGIIRLQQAGVRSYTLDLLSGNGTVAKSLPLPSALSTEDSMSVLFQDPDQPDKIFISQTLTASNTTVLWLASDNVAVWKQLSQGWSGRYLNLVKVFSYSPLSLVATGWDSQSKQRLVLLDTRY